MFLSRLEPNPRHHAARRDLANPYEMHRTLDRAVSEALANDSERVLWRVDHNRDGHMRHLLVQTRSRPDWGFLPDGYLTAPAQSKEVQHELSPGCRFRFRLRANPTIKREGKRHALYDPQQRLEWLERKASQGGFRIRSVMLSGEERIRARKAGKPITLFAATFDGTLEVIDANVFRAVLELGIGSAKGFGMGLLSVAPLPSAS